MDNHLLSKIQVLSRKLIPQGASVLYIGHGGSSGLFPSHAFSALGSHPASGNKTFDYILVSDVSSINDMQAFLKEIRPCISAETRLLFFYSISILNGLSKAFRPGHPDIKNFLSLEGFETIRQSSYFLKGMGCTVARLPAPVVPKPSLTVIVPARNESGNIAPLLKRMPDFGTAAELIFVEGGSTDDTLAEIERVCQAYDGPMSVSHYIQTGKGKGDAVALGFSKAKNDLLMILDADISVDPEDLVKFYDCYASGRGEFINGSRLVYPIAENSMQFLNKIANRLFARAFSILLGQKVKDTLCGTKAISKKNWIKIIDSQMYMESIDPFGDFDLLFGADYLNLKITEVPIHYKMRTYGKTNIKRFSHGYVLAKMLLKHILKYHFF